MVQTGQPAKGQQMHAIYRVTEEAWQLFLLKLRYRDSELLTLSRNKPFLLAGNMAWLVYTGVADVFTVRLEAGQSVGARHHFFRADKDQLMFGADYAGREIGLLVSCAPDTQLLRFDLARLQELAKQDEYAPLIAGMIDQWTTAVGSGLSVPIMPKDYQFIEAGKTVALATGAIVRSGKDVAWARQESGESRYMGRADVPPISAGMLTPLSQHNWLEASAPSTIAGVKSETLLTDDPEWAFLRGFHRLILNCIERDAERDLETESQQIRAGAAIDQGRFETAFATLAAAWGDDYLAPPFEADNRDPLLAACRIVARDLGIMIVTPPDFSAQLKRNDAMAEIARASRIRHRQVALRGDWWREDNGPLIASRGKEASEHPVALIPIEGGRYELRDPVSGETRLVTAELAHELDKKAYMLYRSFPARLLRVRDLVRFGLHGMERDAVIFVGVGIAGGLLGTLTPLIIGTLFDSIIPAGDRSQLTLMFAILLIAAFAVGLFQFARSLVLMRISGRLESSIGAALWDRLLNLPTDFFRKFSAGDLTRRAMGIHDIKEILSGVLLLSLLSGIFSVFNFALLFYYDAGLALVVTAIVLSAILITIALGQLLLRDQRQVTQLQGEISGLIAQLIGGIVKLRVAGAEARAFALWANTFSRQKRLSFRARTVQNMLIVIIAVYPVLAAIVVFGVIYSRHNLTTGRFLAFYAAFALFLTAGLQLGAAFVNGLSVIPIFERLRPIIQTPPEVDELKANPGELSGSIEVSHVSFRYRDDGPLTVNDVSFTVRRGEFVAIVGASGSGKSTLLRLLLGFENPLSGAVYYDGQALTELDLRAVRRQIGAVLQYSQVIAGDILTNIIGSTSLTMDDAWEASRLAGIDATIRELPMGMFTYISEGGATFSGGQRQRLLIARALVTRPRIIFFDEATSALDDKSQAAVTESLKNLQATRFVIAHRLSTVVDADRILVVDKGRIVESGTYEALMSRGGIFAALIRRQLI